MATQLTEERLRTWLASNQVNRERMCLALLALDGRFENPRPRRPKGGPDGARDIEAIFNGTEAWGAVGFRNSADDSSEDKKWVKTKFKSDLESAKSENQNLTAFIFFTNVDLTPAEQKELTLYAEGRGIAHVEIFYRERLRHMLDSPGGLAFRFQYLGINLSGAEQVAFFERFGAQLEQIILKKFDNVDKKLERIEFLHDCTKPLMGVSLVAEFNRQYTPDELGHFRIQIELHNLHGPQEEHSSLTVGCRDAYPTWHSEGKKTPLIGFKSLVWATNPSEVIQNTVISFSEDRASQINSGGHVYKRGPFPNIGALENRVIFVYITKPLFDILSGLGIEANDYFLSGHPMSELDFDLHDPLTAWPETLTEAELQVPWISLRSKRDPQQHPMFWPKAWSLDFRDFTPQKVR